MSVGDHLSSKMKLYGVPSDPGTLKCLMTAGEKGVDVESSGSLPYRTSSIAAASRSCTYEESPVIPSHTTATPNTTRAAAAAQR